MFIYTSAGGRVEGWRHHDEPSHNYKMAAKSIIVIHYPRAAACFIYKRSKEFKKSSRVQEELIHYPRAMFTRLRAEESSDFIEAHCGVPSCKKPYEIVVYLYVCVFDL